MKTNTLKHLTVAVLALTTLIPIAAHADMTAVHQRQKMARDREHEVLVRNRRLSLEQNARSRQHDEQSRARDRQNFLRSQHKTMKH